MRALPGHRRGCLQRRVGATLPDYFPPLLELVTIAGNTSSATKVGGGTLYWPPFAGPGTPQPFMAWRAAVFALVMDVTQHISSINGFLPIRFLILFWMKAWPVVLAVNLIAASTRRIQLARLWRTFPFSFPRCHKSWRKLRMSAYASSFFCRLQTTCSNTDVHGFSPPLEFAQFGPQVALLVMTIALAGAPWY